MIGLAAIKTSKLLKLSISTFLKASLNTLLILFLRTAPPIFLLTPNPILTGPPISALLYIYNFKYLSLLHEPSFITLEKSLFLLSVSNLILVFLFHL